MLETERGILRMRRTLRDLLPPRMMHVADVVLEDDRFWERPASINKHHCRKGGLAAHTSQTLGFALAMAGQARRLVDLRVVAMASLWHDYGKVFGYEQLKDKRSFGGGRESAVNCWGKNRDSLYRGHVVVSYHEFVTAAEAGEFPRYFIDEVGHCILAHHGRMEWGSPVTPHTREAWIVNLADVASVQVFESRDDRMAKQGVGDGD
jgi:3'-5' exoribonuclease